MLTLDSVKLRLEREQPLTFLEFNYMILQGYDFVELQQALRLHAADGRLGSVGQHRAGRRAGRRVREQELFGLTTPLITTASGAKMGKTASGAVWLNADRLSPYDYWQFWRNTEDADVGRFLRLFTDLPLERDRAAGAARGRRDQRGQEDPRHRGDAAVPWRSRGARGVRRRRRSLRRRRRREGLPTYTLRRRDAARCSMWSWRSAWRPRKSEARRLIEQGGVKLNDQPVQSATAGSPRRTSTPAVRPPQRGQEAPRADPTLRARAVSRDGCCAEWCMNQIVTNESRPH